MANLSSITNLAIQLQTTRLMQAGRETLYNLQAEVASGKKTSDITTLGATSTRALLAARTGQTKYDNYTLAIQTVDTRLKIQAQSLSGMSDLANTMSTMISSQQLPQAATDAGAAEQYKSFLLQAQVLLNSKVEDRFLYAGSRYGTQPVRDLTTLPVPPTEAYPFTPATSPALPIYDSDAMDNSEVTSMTANNSASTLQLGSSTWEAQGYAVGDTVTLNGVRGITDGTTFTISALSGDTATVTPPPNDIGLFGQGEATSIAADNGASTLTLGSGNWADQGIQVGDSIQLGGTGADGTYTVTGLAGGVATVTPAPTTIAADGTFVVATQFSNPDTAFSAVRNNATVASAYQQESAYIDDGLKVKYGISSDDPAFQNLVMGIRWAYAATQDPTNYTTYMSRANDLITTAKGQLRGLEADTASNQGLLDTTLTAHKSTISDYKDQESNVIDADVSEAATQLSILSAQIEASYAATGRILSLSIVSYL